MHYEAILTATDITPATGSGATEEDAIANALNSTAYWPNVPATDIDLRLYRVTGDDVELAYAGNLWRYRIATL